MLAKNAAEIRYASNEIGYVTTGTATGSLEGSSPALYARFDPRKLAGSLKDRLVWTPKRKALGNA